MPANFFYHVQLMRVEHGYFIDDQYSGLTHARAEARIASNFFKSQLIQIFPHAHAAPGMNGNATDMRGRDAGRSGDRSGNVGTKQIVLISPVAPLRNSPAVFVKAFNFFEPISGIRLLTL